MRPSLFSEVQFVGAHVLTLQLAVDVQIHLAVFHAEGNLESALIKLGLHPLDRFGRLEGQRGVRA